MSTNYLQPGGRRLVTLAADDGGRWQVLAGDNPQPWSLLVSSEPDLPMLPHRTTVVVPHFDDARPLAKQWAITWLNGGPEPCQPGPAKSEAQTAAARPGSSTPTSPSTPRSPLPISSARRLTQLFLPLE